MSDIEFTIERDGYETIRLDTDGGGQFGLQANTVGLGVPPVVPQFMEGLEEGGELLGERVGMQPLDLAVIFQGSERMKTGSLVRQMAIMVRYRENTPLPRLVATYATGEIYELPFTYVSGLELEHANALPWKYETTLSLMCPKPYWVARNAESFTVRSEISGQDLLSDLAAMPLGSSTALGEVEVENTGDVHAYLDWRVKGPADAVSVSLDGVGFEIDATLTETDVRFIDGRAATMKDPAGDSRYTEFLPGSAPKFPRLPPGRSTLTIEMVGAAAGTYEVSDMVLYTNRVTEPNLKGTAATWSTWSDGNGTQSQATTGFAGTTNGYMQVLWSTTADPHAAIMVDVPAAMDDVLSPQMTVYSSRAQIVQAAFWVFDSSGDVLSVTFGPSQELPAGVPVKMSIPGSVIGTLPAATASARFVVSTFIPECVQWQSGDVFRGSLGAVTDSATVLDYFDGDSDYSEWTGTVNQSTSVQYALELVGASEVSGSFRPRKALVY